MRTTTVSSKGQITIPAELIRELELTAGTKLLVIPINDGIVLMREPASVTDYVAGSIKSVYGDAVEYVRTERESWSRTSD